ncbi:RidA family protein [Pontibacter locisalis]|uniref:RidA family protein n=1 Tax=Pontibacter locisalis TaxID=1719035 RepID=A0ABW5IVU0_9BACT
MKKSFFLFIVICFSVACHAQAQGQFRENGKILHMNPEGEQEWNYAQAYRSGNLLFISGTVGNGDMDKAMEHVYKVLQLTLKKYNLNFTHVVKENVYTKDIEAVIRNRDIRKKYYGTHTPASTMVEITRLFDPESVLEVALIVEFVKE